MSAMFSLGSRDGSSSAARQSSPTWRTIADTANVNPAINHLTVLVVPMPVRSAGGHRAAQVLPGKAPDIINALDGAPGRLLPEAQRNRVDACLGLFDHALVAGEDLELLLAAGFPQCLNGAHHRHGGWRGVVIRSRMHRASRSGPHRCRSRKCHSKLSELIPEVSRLCTFQQFVFALAHRLDRSKPIALSEGSHFGVICLH